MEHITIPEIQMIILAVGIIAVLILLSKIKRKPKSPRDILEEEVSFIKNITPPKNSFISCRGSLIEDEFIKALEKLEISSVFKARLIVGLIGYLKAPVIEDDIEDDKRRNECELSFYEEKRDVYYFYRSNRLRKTNIRDVLLLCSRLLETNVIHDDSLSLTESLLWDKVSLPNPAGKHSGNKLEKYESLPKADKFTIVEEVAGFVRLICIAVMKEAEKIN